MILLFWVSAALSVGWRFWPRVTWIVVLAWMVAGAASMAVTAHPTTALGTLTTIFGGWQVWLVVLAGYLFGGIVAYGVRQDWRRTRR